MLPHIINKTDREFSEIFFKEVGKDYKARTREEL
jgi:hypothetical protein